MRGRTNIIARPNAIVNANVEEFVAAEKIDVGDFVEISYVKKNMKNFFENTDYKQTCAIDDSRVLIMHKPGSSSSSTNYVVDIFIWNGNELVKSTEQTLITSFTSINLQRKIELLKETDGYKYFYYMNNGYKVVIFRVSKTQNIVEMKTFGITWTNNFVGTQYKRSSSVVLDYLGVYGQREIGVFKIDDENLLLFDDITVRYYTKGQTGSGSTVDTCFYRFVKVNLLLTESLNDFNFTINSSMNEVDSKNDVSDSVLNHSMEYILEPECMSPICLINGNFIYIIATLYWGSSSENWLTRRFCFNFSSMNFDGVLIKYLDLDLITYSTTNISVYPYITKLNDESFFILISLEKSIHGSWVYTDYGNVKQSVNFFHGSSSYSKRIAYYNIKDNLIFGLFTNGYDNYFRMLKYNALLNLCELIPESEVEVDDYSTKNVLSNGVFALSDNVFVVIGREYDVFSISNDELHRGEFSNNVKKFSGDYNAIGFAKTGGLSGDIIQVYVPQK